MAYSLSAFLALIVAVISVASAVVLNEEEKRRRGEKELSVPGKLEGLAGWDVVGLQGFPKSNPSSIVMGGGSGQNPAYWTQIGREELSRSLAVHPINRQAKNVILFVGDGMSVGTVTASRIYDGQSHNKPGEEGSLFFEQFPYLGHSKTYSVDRQTTDSAATATAMLTGVKNNHGTINVDGTVARYNCTAQKGHELTSILHWSQAAGKDVGVVTTTRVTHATPAATYASSASRGWEGDSEMDGVDGGCKDIAKQLVDDNPDIKVIMGGGRRYFQRNTDNDPETGSVNSRYGRRDGRNLIEDWKADKVRRGFTAEYIWSRNGLHSLDVNNTDYVLGLFEDSHMEYEVYRKADPDTREAGEPSLAEMTATAIDMLSKGDNGFFLLVEGGRIDHGHHGNRAKRAFGDTVAFDMAVREAAHMTSAEDTLIMVTADHSHVFSMAGYPSRGNSITGLSGYVGSDNLPYTTTLYGNGPGYSLVDGKREDITNVRVESRSYRSQSALPLSSETHSGEDVAIYARGPMAHLVHATHEQVFIPHVMAYASCVGIYANEPGCVTTFSEPDDSEDDYHP